jgi:ribosomal protein S6--L-glutamate ligase
MAPGLAAIGRARAAEEALRRSMRLCFIIEEEYRRDRMPLRVANQLTAWGHDVHLLHPQASATCLSALARAGDDHFDAYVLKTVSDGPGICILEAAAASGIAAINDPRAIRLTRDKAAAAARARAAEIPFPLTYFVVDVSRVGLIPREHYPLVIKPSNGSSTRQVHRINDPAELRELELDPHDRFFLAQRYVENEGYDLKLYCIGREVFAVRRTSPLHPGRRVHDGEVEVTPELAAIVRNVRRVFGLDIFGVDVVRASRGWVAVDINDFPGFGGVPGAVTHVATRIAHIARGAAMRRAISSRGRHLLRGLGASPARLRSGRDRATQPLAAARALALPAATAHGAALKVCLLVDRLGHRVLESAARELSDAHGAAVTVVDVGRTQPPDDADLYLLKSRTDRALRAARRVELAGAAVVNSAPATGACLDRVVLAERMSQAGLPFPDTWSGPTLESLIVPASGRDQEWPIVVKSRRSRRGDLVCVIRSSAELHALAAEWANEPVVAQRIVRHDGWEHKVWVIGGRLYCARRRAEFAEHRGRADVSMPREQLSDAIEGLARAVGAAFGLELYGVDVLVSERGPVVVDVNPFPGFRRMPSAGAAIAGHVMRVARREWAPA